MVVLVAVVLWLVYLLPSWHGRHQYYAAERNAVRLNQALRVLAETSETPQEVRLELNARTASPHHRRPRPRRRAGGRTRFWPPNRASTGCSTPTRTSIPMPGAMPR